MAARGRRRVGSRDRRGGDPLVDLGELAPTICVQRLVAGVDDRGRRKASQERDEHAGNTDGTESRTTTAVVIPLSFPCVAPYAGDGVLYTGCGGYPSRLGEAVRRPLHSTSAGGGDSFPATVFVTTIDQER